MFTVLWKTEDNNIFSHNFNELVDALDKYNKLYKLAGVLFAEVKQENVTFLSFRKEQKNGK